MRASDLSQPIQEWPVISARQALARMAEGGVGLDVRSPKEFLQGSLPGFTNLAVLDDEQRHLVGLEYKTHGQVAALHLGMELTAPKRSEVVRGWQDFFAQFPVEHRLLICWRGGLRSKISAQWLADKGVFGQRVEGGYKALRSLLLENFNQLPPLVLLAGMTGVGKTDLLRRLPKRSILDLEAYANHRGSAFGAHWNDVQPTQATFENRLAWALAREKGPRIIEAESRMIGYCCLPTALHEAMAESSVVILEDEMSVRILRVFEEYVARPIAIAGPAEVCRVLRASVERLRSKLGGLRARQLDDSIVQAFSDDPLQLKNHASWIESLLSEYYDPSYVHSLRQKTSEILFRGNASAVEAYLTDYLNRRRT